jgi:hypothetical protein
VADAILHAAGQAWPPFVLVSGLLLIGAVVEADGLFRAVGMRIERLGGGPITLLAVLLGVEAIVTALLNLDTAVVFLTPIILHAARQRRCDEHAFLYGSLFMANGGLTPVARVELDESDRPCPRAPLWCRIRSFDASALARGRRRDGRVSCRRLSNARSACDGA